MLFTLYKGYWQLVAMRSLSGSYRSFSRFPDGISLSVSLSEKKMSLLLIRVMLFLLLMLTIPQKSAGEFEQWCIADEQTPDDELKVAMDWACGNGGADCSKIQVNQPCYFPNTMRNHASYAFNDYFQKFKHKGGSCNFKGAAMITELDPSYDSCQYEFIP